MILLGTAIWSLPKINTHFHIYFVIFRCVFFRQIILNFSKSRFILWSKNSVASINSPTSSFSHFEVCVLGLYTCLSLTQSENVSGSNFKIIYKLNTNKLAQFSKNLQKFQNIQICSNSPVARIHIYSCLISLNRDHQC